MKNIVSACFAAGILASATCLAAPPADAPAGSTGLCKDGTYYSGAEKKGACRGHKGVKELWGGDAGAAKPEAKVEPKGTAQGATTTPAPAAPTPPPAAAPSKTAANKPAATPAPGGGPGMVWANENSKVYHCPGDKWYGRTKQGEYLSEADAKAKGFKPDHGKACQ